MIKDFVLAWEKHKSDLENYIRNTPQNEYNDYTSLVKLLFEYVINPYVRDFNIKDGWGDTVYDTDKILTIDDGDYQGTQIFILHRKCYQPSVNEYVYTNTYYGSCSGCDTLQAIHNYDVGIPNENQVKDYMTLLLHLLQSCVYMVDGESESNNDNP